MKNILNYKIIILWLFILLSSFYTNNHSKIYYYERKCRHSQSVSYEARLFVQNGNNISVNIYKYRGEKVCLVGGGLFQLRNKSIHRFESKKDSIGQCYLTLQKDTCIIFKWLDPRTNQILQTRYQYIEQTNLTINGKKQEVYKFERTMGENDVIQNVYFSLNFIPIWEEYASGFTLMPCDIKLVDAKKVPKDFKLQVEKIIKKD